MLPHFNYKSIISAYREVREKYFHRRYCIIAAAIFLICVIGSLFLVIQNDNASTQQNTDKALAQPVPLPLEINANFLTQVEECFIPIAAAYRYTLRISSGFRTVEEQNELYNQGRTINGHIVTEAKGGRSIHSFGFAVDVVDRWKEYDVDWEKIGKIAEYCGLEHGDEGDISHFEIRDGLSIEQFIAGMRPSPRTLPCAIMDERAKANQPLTLKDLQNCGAPKF